MWARLGLTEGERRRVTALFSDVSGFTAMSEKLDPEEANSIMKETMAELTAIIRKHDGYVEKFIGDAICAIFGAPVSHEDEPERAALAAIEMHAALDERAARRPDLPAAADAHRHQHRPRHRGDRGRRHTVRGHG